MCAKKWFPGDDLSAFNLNRTGGIGEIITPLDEDDNPTTPAQIQSIIDLVASEGGGTIIVRSGLYNLDDDIFVKSNIGLVAESFGSVIFNFIGDKGIKLHGDLISDTGTVSINNGSQTVTGSGTQFVTDGVEAGHKIFLWDKWWDIGSVNSETELVLTSVYTAGNISGVDTKIADTLKNVELISIVATGSDGAGFSIDLAENIFAEGGSVGNGIGVKVTRSSVVSLFSFLCDLNGIGFDLETNKTILRDVIAENSLTNGLIIRGGRSNIIEDVGIWNSGGDGIVINGSTENTKILSSLSKFSTGNGMLIEDCDNIFVSGMFLEQSGGDGIKLINSDKCIITGCSLENNTGYGANIDGDENIINGNSFSNNTAGHINDTGTGTVINGNSPSVLNDSPFDLEVFTSNGTWTNNGHKLIEVELVGGGGSGNNTGVNSSGGNGAGAGGYARKIIDVSEIESVSVTVGTGGTGVTSSIDGNNGTASSFGTHLSATGGGGAVSGTIGGLGGVGSDGDINIAGSDGQTGSVGGTNQGRNGNGGSSVLGGSSRGTGKNYGGGGAGAMTGTSSAGANGVVIVKILS
jgi:hypothetical protein